MLMGSISDHYSHLPFGNAVILRALLTEFPILAAFGKSNFNVHAQAIVHIFLGNNKNIKMLIAIVIAKKEKLKLKELILQCSASSAEACSCVWRSRSSYRLPGNMENNPWPQNYHCCHLSKTYILLLYTSFPSQLVPPWTYWPSLSVRFTIPERKK